MSQVESCASWVVFRMAIHGKLCETNAVCKQDEWNAMERARPGANLLVKDGIGNEGEAERYARCIPVVKVVAEPAAPAVPEKLADDRLWLHVPSLLAETPADEAISPVPEAQVGT
jgi:hypothetical protein